MIIETKKRQENEWLISMCTMLINVHSHFKQPLSKKLFLRIGCSPSLKCVALYTKIHHKHWSSEQNSTIMCLFIKLALSRERKTPNFFLLHVCIGSICCLFQSYAKGFLSWSVLIPASEYSVQRFISLYGIIGRKQDMTISSWNMKT